MSSMGGRLEMDNFQRKKGEEKRVGVKAELKTLLLRMPSSESKHEEAKGEDGGGEVDIVREGE